VPLVFVCVCVAAARRGVPHLGARAVTAARAPSAWQPSAADGNDGGGRRANGRLVATRAPLRRAARRRRMVLGAARPAPPARQPFLPAFTPRHRLAHLTSSLL